LKVIIIGGGIIGLCAGMLLADDGHDVTILERDAAPPPDPSAAWGSWERRGVNQFRLPHFFLSRFRILAESELPDLIEAVTAAGGCRYNVVANIPDELKGGTRPADDVFDTLTGRRCVVESAAAHVAEHTPGLTIRRGAAVRGLLTGASANGQAPNIHGVLLESGERITADVVVDASGRRSPLPRWLAEIGAAPVVEQAEDCGFVYYGRHFQSPDGTLPVMIGPPRQGYGTIDALTLPADNGTWSVTITASAKDTTLRQLKDPAKWATAVRQLPLAAHWIDAEPIDETVAVIAKIEDRIRDFAPGGRPVATGVLAVGDAWACTNPSLGRGVSIGLMHAVALRDLLRTADGDPWATAVGWADATRQLEPWYATTVNYDRHRLAQIDALIDGRPYSTDDEEWNLTSALQANAFTDGDLLRAFIETAMVLRHPDEVLADPALRAFLLSRPEKSDAPPSGPDRAQLLAAIDA
jgi:2-polyprenyl-6-methoxyphenol hydroxylase-like FAD-dependent oxidoreductase